MPVAERKRLVKIHLIWPFVFMGIMAIALAGILNSESARQPSGESQAGAFAMLMVWSFFLVVIWIFAMISLVRGTRLALPILSQKIKRRLGIILLNSLWVSVLAVAIVYDIFLKDSLSVGLPLVFSQIWIMLAVPALISGIVLLRSSRKQNTNIDAQS